MPALVLVVGSNTIFPFIFIALVICGAVCKVRMMARDPLLKKLFMAYTVMQGQEMFAACKQRLLEGDVTFFAPRRKL